MPLDLLTGLTVGASLLGAGMAVCSLVVSRRQQRIAAQGQLTSVQALQLREIEVLYSARIASLEGRIHDTEEKATKAGHKAMAFQVHFETCERNVARLEEEIARLQQRGAAI